MKYIYMLLLSSLLITLKVSAIQNNDLENAKKLLNEGKFEEGKTILEEIIEEDDKNHEAYFLLGRTYMALEDFEEATEYFEEAVELKDKNADYHFWLGRAIGADAQESSVISQAMMAPDILEEFERTVELDPNHIEGRVAVINFYIIAPGIMGGDIEKAELNAKALIELDEMRGRSALARIYLEKEEINSVQIQLDKLEINYKNDPALGNLYNTLGYYYLQEENNEKAIEAFEKQVEINPTNANSYDSLGDGYRAANRYDEAISQYKKALEINPDFTPSLENLENLQEEMVNE